MIAILDIVFIGKGYVAAPLALHYGRGMTIPDDGEKPRLGIRSPTGIEAAKCAQNRVLHDVLRIPGRSGKPACKAMSRVEVRHNFRLEASSRFVPSWAQRIPLLPFLVIDAVKTLKDRSLFQKKSNDYGVPGWGIRDDSKLLRMKATSEFAYSSKQSQPVGIPRLPVASVTN
jgi:hypothetical protein